MRINPDVELCAEGFADLRHIQARTEPEIDRQTAVETKRRTT